MIQHLRKSVIEFAFLFLLLIVTSEGQGNTKKCLKKEGKFPIPGSFCTSYYICKNWRLVDEVVCPEDHHFNAINGYCDWKELYPCLEKPQRKECPRPNGRFLKPKTECKKYFDCCKGKPTVKKCPKEQLFDPERGICDWEELVTSCKDISKTKECPKPNGRFVKPSSECRKYFECRNGKHTEKKCPKNLLFNVKTKECDWEKLVTCKGKETSDESSSKESEESTSDEENSDESTVEFSTASTTNEVSTLSKITTPTDIVSESTPIKISSKWTTEETLGSSQFRQTNSPDIVAELTSEQLSSSTTTEFFSTRQTMQPTFDSTLEEYFSTRQTMQPTYDSTPSEYLSTRQTMQPTTDSTPEEYVSTNQTMQPTFDSTPGEYLSTSQTMQPTFDSTPEEHFTTKQTMLPTYDSTPNENISSLQTEQSTFSEIFTVTTPKEISRSYSTEQPKPFTDEDEKTNDTSTQTLQDRTTEDYVSSSASTSKTNIIKTFTSTLPSTSIDLGTIDPVADFVCPEPTGYYPHPTDKHKFIGCVHNRPSILECPSNLIYSDKYKRCVYP